MKCNCGMPLGPQCLLCRKRRVKCDSAKPTCLRCSREGRSCPGYTKPFRWKAFDPSEASSKQRLSHPAGSKDTGSISTSSANGGPPKLLTAKISKPLTLTTPLFLPADRRVWRVAESARYFASVLVPDLAPFPKIYRNETQITVQTWISCPQILQNILLVIYLNHRLVRQNASHRSSAELLEYRGEALTQLRLELESASHGLSFIAAVAVLMVLQAEVQISPVSGWHIHLEAARKILTQLGGLAACWDKLAELRPLFTMFIQMDIMSMTTTPTHILCEVPLEAFNFELEDLGSFDEHILTTCCPCPVRILGLIRGINSVRHAASLGSMIEEDGLLDLCTTIEQLLEFNAAEWALELIETKLPALDVLDSQICKASAIEEWRCLGVAYQAAAVLYAIRSAKPHMLERELSAYHDLVEHQRQQLGLVLEILLRTSSECGPEAASGMKLWKFVLWPLFIDSYEICGWGSQDESSRLSRISRLRGLGARLGSKSFLGAASQLQIVAEQRQQRHTRDWRWNDGFDDRCIFVV